jgi:hypothetical protein
VRSLARLACALVAAIVLALACAPVAMAAPGANWREPPARGNQVTLSNPAPTRDSTIDVFSSGWRPDRAVEIALGGIVVSRVHADAGGFVRAEVRVPADARAGFGVLTVSGASATGVPQQIVAGLSVVADHAPRSSPRPWFAVSLVLALATLLLLVSQRVEARDTRLAS